MLSIVIGVITLTIISVVIFVVVDKHATKKKEEHTQFVINNSIAIKSLLEINNKYKSVFYNEIKNFNIDNTYDNAKYYNIISCQDYLIYKLQFLKQEISREIRYINANKKEYDAYCKEISQINTFGKFSIGSSGLDSALLLRKEKEIFEQKKLKPILDFNFLVCLYCASMSGWIYNQKKAFFSHQQVSDLLTRLDNKNGTFYNDREIWEALCRVERGKVTNKLRFAIYERDGYCCRRCGKSGDKVTLEIDHIQPIAKGGKTVYSNLQTLCSECNKNKGDTY